MKALNKIYAIALLALGLTSCLQDKEIEDQKYGMIDLNAKRIIELPANSSHTSTFALAYEDKETVLDFVTVRLAAEQVAAEDITVKLSLASSQAIIDAYNEAEEAELVEYPSSLYELQGSGLSVTIPKGSRTGVLKLAMNPVDLDPSTTYALGFTIESVDKSGYTISGNFDNLLVTIGAKNAYDAVYRINPETSSIVDANGLYTDDYPRDISLSTRTANSVVYYDESYAYNNLIVNSIATGGAANSGIRPIYTFDPATGNLVSVTDFNDGTRVFTNVEGKFNEADRSIYIKWTAGRWTVTENYVFLRER
ncbi:DUF1735 domain-containing protein [uncultured Pontibacter sp.]|uniref:DUF1735 domain-containing protein n=1 Tax=uncultured Pontibacter sp. TaxID=453356 RepID=UPI002628443C|nr:DUF1735 domain-containing protein [uncultured Pontibacter sp.]